jgi:hypothetical protein
MPGAVEASQQSALECSLASREYERNEISGMISDVGPSFEIPTSRIRRPAYWYGFNDSCTMPVWYGRLLISHHVSVSDVRAH